MKKIFAAIIILLFISVTSFADTIKFKSGKIIDNCKVVNMTEKEITVNLYDVTEMTYSLSDIEEVNGEAVGLPAVKEAPADSAVESAPQQEVEVPVSEPEAPELLPTGTPQEYAGEPAPAVGQDHPQTTLPPEEAKKVLAVLAGFFVIFLIIIIIAYIYGAVCLQLIAQKTNQAPAWMAWIPIANLFLMCRIGGVQYIWLLLLLVSFIPLLGRFLGPICDLVLFGFLWYRIALARAKPGWIGAITVIPIVGLFTMGYLAFSKKEEGTPPPPDIGRGEPIS